MKMKNEKELKHVTRVEDNNISKMALQRNNAYRLIKQK